jgi:hypothetical protein
MCKSKPYADVGVIGMITTSTETLRKTHKCHNRHHKACAYGEGRDSGMLAFIVNVQVRTSFLVGMKHEVPNADQQRAWLGWMYTVASLRNRLQDCHAQLG